MPAGSVGRARRGVEFRPHVRHRDYLKKIFSPRGTWVTPSVGVLTLGLILGHGFGLPWALQWMWSLLKQTNKENK